MAQTAIGLSWTSPARNTEARAAVTGYKVEVSENGTSGWLLLATTTDAAPTTYEHTGLRAGTTRYYRVIATSDAGDSQPSNIVQATPGLVPADLIMRALGARVALGTVSSNYAKSEASAADKNFLSRFADSSFYLAFESQSQWRTWMTDKLSLGGILNVRLTTVPVEPATVMADSDDPPAGTVEPGASTDGTDINLVPRASTEVQIGALFNFWKPSFRVASHNFRWGLALTTRTVFHTSPASHTHGSPSEVVMSWPAGLRLSLYENASAGRFAAYVDYSPFLLYGSREEHPMVRPDIEARGWIGKIYLGFDIKRGGNRHDDLRILVGATLSLGDILP